MLFSDAFLVLYQCDYVSDAPILASVYFERLFVYLGQEAHSGRQPQYENGRSR
jgi:hypothetical protein